MQRHAVDKKTATTPDYEAAVCEKIVSCTNAVKINGMSLRLDGVPFRSDNPIGGGKNMFLKFGPRGMRKGLWKAKFDEEADFEVYLAVASQKPCQISEK